MRFRTLSIWFAVAAVVSTIVSFARLAGALPPQCAATELGGSSLYQGACAGCGTNYSSWATARDNAVAACQGTCSGTCTVSTGAGDGCEFDGTSNGYICNSYCTGTAVSVGTCSTCGTNRSSWSTADDVAVAACENTCTTGTCSVSASAGDQCGFDTVINGYRCNSTCVCTPTVDAGSDSGTSDSGTLDSGVVDGSAGDSGGLDSGVEDSGSAEAGARDAESSDAGSEDSGGPDAIAADSGSPDSGAMDSSALSEGGSEDDASSEAAPPDAGGTAEPDAETSEDGAVAEIDATVDSSTGGFASDDAGIPTAPSSSGCSCFVTASPSSSPSPGLLIVGAGLAACVAIRRRRRR